MKKFRVLLVFVCATFGLFFLFLHTIHAQQCGGSSQGTSYFPCNQITGGSAWQGQVLQCSSSQALTITSSQQWCAATSSEQPVWFYACQTSSACAPAPPAPSPSQPQPSAPSAPSAPRMPPVQCSSSGNPSSTYIKTWTEYQCQSSACGGAISSRVASQACKDVYTSRVENGCLVWDFDLAKSGCEDPTYQDGQAQTCGAFQQCTGQGWVKADAPLSLCQCKGSCYPAPELKKLDDAGLSPQNVFEDAKNTKAKLPVAIGVEDLGGNSDMRAQSCTVDSYQYEFSDGSRTVSGNGSTSFVLPSCSLAADASYKVTAQACLNNECGQKSKQLAFDTSASPELKLPYDPDWQAQESATSPFPVTLEWCPYQSSSVQSFAVNAYKANEDGSRGESVLGVSGVSGDQTAYADSSSQGHLNDLKRGVPYFWEIAPCTDADAKICGVFSQLWKVVPGGKLETPLFLLPSSGTFVNMQDALSWQNIVFATHFALQVQGSNLAKIFFIQDNKLPLKDIWRNLLLNTSYQWKVAACGGAPNAQNIADCENENGLPAWSQENQFTTTGAKPTGLATKPEKSGKIAIPATLFWDANATPGAAGYRWEANGTTGFATDSQVVMPDLQQNTAYSWRVKTCADTLGKVCGQWSAPENFTTTTLVAPVITSPAQDTGALIPQVNAAWDPVFSANFYTYGVQYVALASNEKSLSCKPGAVVTQTITNTNQSSTGFRVHCMGSYQLQVAGCIDEKCNIKGPASTQLFEVKEPPIASGGLVPCGRTRNDPSTPWWDERDDCQLKHVFLLIHNLVDFVLWKVTLVLLIVYGATTGAVLYFSLGDITTIAKVKSIWKAFGIGVLIIFFAWLFLNIILGLLGFNVNFYGRWYEIKT